MDKEILELSIFDFIKKPSAENSFKIIKNCKAFIIGQVSKWKNPDLSPQDKIKELMSEMFLVLMEDFSAERLNNPKGLLSYLKLKMRRLTRPYMQKSVSFGLSSDFEDLGRCNFNASRHDLMMEVVECVRASIKSESKPEVAYLEFLFIHVFPELAWISRFAAKQKNEELSKRIEKDKKRHQAFNNSLRHNLCNLNHGHWQEILDWSPGERNHLAWKISEISPKDVSPGIEDRLKKLDDWRSSFCPSDEQSIENFKNAYEILKAMKQVPNDKFTYMAAENAATYGEGENILNQLLAPLSLKVASEAVMEGNANYETKDNLDGAFEKAKEEIESWLAEFLKEKNI